jgi:hypothetical protein
MVAPLPATDGSNPPGGNPSMARVAMDGTYIAEHLAPGEYTVIAALPGYLSRFDDLIPTMLDDSSPAAERKLLASLGTVTITGGETETYDITLERGAALSGRVLYSDGAPATQVIIEVEDVAAKKLSGEKQQQAMVATTMMRSIFTHQNQDTDDQGRFRISGLKPGTYRVAAISSSTNPDSQAGDMPALGLLLGGMADPGALRVYSGDTLHSKAAKTYEVRSGDEVSGIDITIPLNAYHQVKGILTAVDGRVINRATLTLTDTTDDSVTYQSQPADDGTFAFSTVANGTYTLAAKDARIIAREPGSNPDIPTRYVPTKATNAFADNTTSVIVKDSDVPDVALTLTEVPLPPEPTPPNVMPPNPDDQPEP